MAPGSGLEYGSSYPLMPDLAVVIVSWNTRQLTLDTLRTLYADLETQDEISSEVWVVDNASADGSVEAIQAQFPQAKLIASEKNLGFGAGNNAAIRAIGFGRDVTPETLPRAVYLLNSDTLTHPGATRTLYEALLVLPDAGVVGARLTYSDGSFQHSAFAFPGLAQLWIDLMPAPSRFYDSWLNGRYARKRYAGTTPFEVGHTLGATMMLRREVIQQTGMFDEDFYMYGEEVDWMWRIQRAGWKIYCVPSAHVTHLGGQSTKQVRPQSVINLWESRLRLFDKYYPRWKIPLARQLIRWGMGRKIKQEQRDSDLPSEERAALIGAYRTVIERTKDHA